MAQRGHGGAYHLLPVLCAGDVQPHKTGLAASRSDVRDDLAPFCFKQVSHDDPGPFLGKQLGFGLAHAIGGARNERDFPL